MSISAEIQIIFKDGMLSFITALKIMFSVFNNHANSQIVLNAV
jgi:hypothetical protein